MHGIEIFVAPQFSFEINASYEPCNRIRLSGQRDRLQGVDFYRNDQFRTSVRLDSQTVSAKPSVLSSGRKCESYVQLGDDFGALEVKGERPRSVIFDNSEMHYLTGIAAKMLFDPDWIDMLLLDITVVKRLVQSVEKLPPSNLARVNFLKVWEFATKRNPELRSLMLAPAPQP